MSYVVGSRGTLSRLYTQGTQAQTAAPAPRGPSLYRCGLAAPPPGPVATRDRVDWIGLAGVAVAIGGAAVLINAVVDSQRPRAVHDRRVRRIAEDYEARGYDVAADIKGWPKPPVMNGHRADVVASRGKRAHVVEVEHEHTLDTTHTRNQIQALTTYCAEVTSHRATLTVDLTRYRSR